MSYSKIMSVVGGEAVIGYNVKTKEKERPMKIKEIIKIGDTKRYRFAGVDAETGDNMSVMCGEAKAKIAEKELKMKIKTVEPKEKKTKSCKAVAKRAEKRCEAAKKKEEGSDEETIEMTKEEIKKASKPKKPAKKATTAKKPAVKKETAPKKPAAKKGTAKKPGRPAKKSPGY